MASTKNERYWFLHVKFPLVCGFSPKLIHNGKNLDLNWRIGPFDQFAVFSLSINELFFVNNFSKYSFFLENKRQIRAIYGLMRLRWKSFREPESRVSKIKYFGG